MYNVATVYYAYGRSYFIYKNCLIATKETSEKKNSNNNKKS